MDGGGGSGEGGVLGDNPERFGHEQRSRKKKKKKRRALHEDILVFVSQEWKDLDMEVNEQNVIV